MTDWRTSINSWWRPLTGLLCLPAAPYVTWIGYVIGKPVPYAAGAFALVFIAYLYSFRGWEKLSLASRTLAAAAGDSTGTAAVGSDGTVTAAAVASTETDT